MAPRIEMGMTRHTPERATEPPGPRRIKRVKADRGGGEGGVTFNPKPPSSTPKARGRVLYTLAPVADDR